MTRGAPSRRPAVLQVLVLWALAAAGTAAATEPPANDEILVMLRMPPDHHRPNAVYGGGYGDPFALKARRRLAQRIARREGVEVVADGWQMPLLGVDCYVMRVRPGETVESAIQRISADPEILWSQPMHIYQSPDAGVGAEPR